MISAINTRCFSPCVTEPSCHCAERSAILTPFIAQLTKEVVLRLRLLRKWVKRPESIPTPGEIVRHPAGRTDGRTNLFISLSPFWFFRGSPNCVHFSPSLIIQADLLYWSPTLSLFFLSWTFPRPTGQKKRFLTLKAQSCRIWLFSHLKLCLATATHNSKWLKIT